MWDRFAKKLPINPGERFITLLMFLYIFGVMGFYYILKPLRSFQAGEPGWRACFPHLCQVGL